jgi:hypothetical protein
MGDEAVETVPTIGLNVKVFKKGKVNIIFWDIGGPGTVSIGMGRYQGLRRGIVRGRCGCAAIVLQKITQLCIDGSVDRRPCFRLSQQD